MSPARSRNDLSQQSFSVADIDPEAVRAGLRDFVQTLANAERERVSAKGTRDIHIEQTSMHNLRQIDLSKMLYCF